MAGRGRYEEVKLMEMLKGLIITQGQATFGAQNNLGSVYSVVVDKKMSPGGADQKQQWHYHASLISYKMQGDWRKYKLMRRNADPACRTAVEALEDLLETLYAEM